MTCSPPPHPKSARISITWKALWSLKYVVGIGDVGTRNNRWWWIGGKGGYWWWRRVIGRVKDGLAGLLLFDTVWLGCSEKGLVFSSLRVGVDSKLEGYICDGSLLGVGGGEKTCIPRSQWRSYYRESVGAEIARFNCLCIPHLCKRDRNVTGKEVLHTGYACIML